MSRRQSGSSPLGASAAGFADVALRHGAGVACAGAKPNALRASRPDGAALASAHCTAALAELGDCTAVLG